MSRARPRLAGAFLLLAGCMGLGRHSDPTKFFTLTPLPGSAGSEHAGDPGPLSLGLGPILLPGYLDRAQLVTRVGPNEVRFAPFDRWAEPLAESFGRTLQQDLLGVLGADRVRSEERRVGKSVDLGGRRIIKKKKNKNRPTLDDEERYRK